MDKTPEKIKEMFNNIASDYDRNNNIISFGLHKLIKKRTIENVNFSGKCLDLCTGTGDIAALLADKCDVIGLDFSPEMIKLARKKHPEIEFIEGDCTDLPFEDNSFDGITISFGLRNIENYDKALDEIYRVLKPNGIFLHLDFEKKNLLANTLYKFFIPKIVSIFYNNTIPYKYLVLSKENFLNSENLIKLFQSHNFKFLQKKDFLLGTLAFQVMRKE